MAPKRTPATTGSDSDGEAFLSLDDYLEALLARWKTILVGGLIGLIVGLGYSATRETTYEATAKILYRNPGAELGVIGDVSAVSAALPQVLPEAQAAALDGLPVAEQAASILGDGSDPVQLLDQIETDVAVDSNLLEITVTDEDPDRAAAIANAIATAGNQITQTDAIEALKTVEAVIQGELQEARQRGRRTEIVATQGQLTRVRSIIKLASPADTVAPAIPPERPAAPRTKRNGLGGLLLGLLAGALLAIGGRVIDRSIRTRADVTRTTGLEVIGSTVARGPEGAQAIAGEGQGFQVMAALLDLPNNDRAVVLVTSPADDDGTAMVAGGLARAFSDIGESTLLIDATGSTAITIPGDDALEVRALETSADDPATTAAVTEMLTVGDEYSRVVVHAPGSLERALPLRLASRADASIVCVRLEQTTKGDAVRAAADLFRSGAESVVAVLTR